MTDLPYGAFTPVEYQGIIRREADALLAMWKRQDAAAAGLTAGGDADLVTRFLAARLTP